MGGMLSRPRTDFDAKPRLGRAAKAWHAPGWAWGLLALTVLLAGCLKLKRVEDEHAVPVDAGSAKTVGVQPVMEAPGQPKDMDVTVTATTSPASPVTLYLVLSSDAEDVMSDLEAGRDPVPSKVLAKSAQGESPTLQGTAPANKDCTVVAANAGGQKTTVNAKIVGKY
jgi:hypothetical protein